MKQAHYSRMKPVGIFGIPGFPKMPTKDSQTPTPLAATPMPKLPKGELPMEEYAKERSKPKGSVVVSTEIHIGAAMPKIPVEKMPMEEYAKERNKKEEIREVHVKKAKGGFVVTTDYDSKPSVYKDLAGVSKCLEDKFKEG